MPRAANAATNAALNGLAGVGNTNVIPFTTLNVGDPGTTGANENANSGSYVRQAATWNVASGGTMTNSGAQAYQTAGTVPVTHFGTVSSATYAAGSYAIGGALGANVTAANITMASGALSIAAS